MQTALIPTASLPVFDTFDGYRKDGSLHVQSLGGDLTMLDDLPQLGLAIVGTRHPQRRSLELLESVVRELRGSGLILISGFARGVDARAHELAIENGLRTIAILGCGIDIDYPREHRALRSRILEAGGLVISPFCAGFAPLARHFIERNGLIAGFAKATWVVEAAAVSGTLNTASWAMKFNRHLYATSCFPGDPFFEGNEKLLGQKRTDRYPVAEALFGAHSLGSTWSGLAAGGRCTQTELPLDRSTLSELQRWVLELEHTFGECQAQALLGRAIEEGLKPGGFFALLEEEVAAGRLSREADGKIRVTTNIAAKSARNKAPGPECP